MGQPFKFAFFCCLVASALPAAALEITVKASGGDADAEATQKILLAPDRLRLDLTAGAEQHRFLYSQPKDAVYLLQPEDKAYSEITRADLQAMSKRLDAAMEKMREQLKNLPPEQREMMEKMMGAAAPQAAAAEPDPPEFKKVGSERIGTWQTTKMEGYREGAKVAEVWIIDWKTAGFEKADLAALKSLGEFYSSVKSGTLPDLNLQAHLDAFDGFPVRIRNLDGNGKGAGSMEVVSIVPGKSPAAAFDIPTGYRKQKMDWMTGSGG